MAAIFLRIAAGDVPESLRDRRLVQLDLAALVAGAKARLMLMQGTAWYNPNQATYYSQIFDNGVGAAAEDAAKSLVGAVIRTKPHH